MKLLLISLLFISNGVAFAQLPKQTGGPTSNVMRSFLNTIYEGQSQNTERAMNQVSQSYLVFLDDFVYEPYCDDERLRGLYKACQTFRSSESAQVSTNEWSKSYSFNKAEFGNRFTSYNFVKSIPLIDNFLCHITLQVSFDLKSKNLINQEYWAHCD